MAVLGFGALFAGLIQVPGVDNVLFGFLDPVFANSPLATIHPSVGAEWRGLAIGGAISIARDRRRLGALGRAAGAARAVPPAPAPGLPALPQQVVLRRG